MGTLQKFKENEDEAKKSDKVQKRSTVYMYSTDVVSSINFFYLGAS